MMTRLGVSGLMGCSCIWQWKREVFTAFCKARYGIVEGGQGGCTRSKTITLAKGER